MRGTRGIVVVGSVLVGAKLVLLAFQKTLPADFLSVLADCGLSILVAVAAWLASRRSSSYARVLWLCVAFVALLWAVNLVAAAVALSSAPLKSTLSARWPTLVLGAFPFAIAFTLPLLLSEDRGRLRINWLQALDIAQFGIIAFSAFLVFFYIPSVHIVADAQRVRHLTVLHLARDGFLALGYLYRGWRSRVPGLRWLQFRMSGFMTIYGVAPALVAYLMKVWHWPELQACIFLTVAPVFLLVTALRWQESGEIMRPEEEPVDQKVLWTQALPLIMPISVVVLAWRIPGEYTRVAWIIVTSSFVLYAARLFLMQRHQNRTLSSLAAMEERFSKAFKSSPAAVVISRLSDGRIVDANDRWLDLMQLTREEILGKTTVELGIVESVEERQRLLDAVRKHRSARGMSLRYRVAGRVMHTLASAEVIELGGEPLIIASILDVTEVRNVTQQLQQAQKMELIGSLAGGVAHDFNNLLTIITGYSALALTRDLNDELAEEIHQIREASGRAAALTRQLLAFSRRQVLQPRNISLNAVVGSIEKLLQRTIGENLELVTSLAPQLGTVNADPVQMEQVVMNLAVNARDAMPHGGKLLFETKNLDLPTTYPEKSFEIPAGSYVMLIVSDTGTGIRPDDLERIFEPFFTTKGVGVGTGLGLSTVYGIVKQSGGYIWAYSDVGVGTTFKVCLPRVDSKAEMVKPAEIEPENLSGTETVLVVDDDPRVCELTANILGRYGYQVVTANSGEDAQRRAAECNNGLHLLVTDVVMAGTSGRELAQQLKTGRPDLKILYMSGYPHVALSAEDMADFSEGMLPKPFAPLDLARQARRALNSA